MIVTDGKPVSGLRLLNRVRVVIFVSAVSVVVAACADTNLGSVLSPIIADGTQTASLPPDRDGAAAAETSATPPTEPASAPRTEPTPSDPLASRRIEPAPASPALTPPAAATTAEQEAVPPAPAPPPPAIELSPPEDAGDGPVRVALLLPLSGPNAAVGRSLLNAALMALFDIGDDRLTLMPKDTEGLPEGAIDAAERAVEDGAEIVLGPLFSASVQGAAQVTRVSGPNMVAFSTDRSVAGAGVFLIGFLPQQQVDRVVAFAASQGMQRFAALLPDNAYGGTISAALDEAVRRNGAVLTRVEVYTGGPDDFHEPVQRLADYQARRAELAALRNQLQARDDEVSRRTLQRLQGRETVGELGFDAVMLAEGGDRLRALAPLLPFYDVDPSRARFLGTGLWDEPGLGREPSLVGGWFAGPTPEANAEFRNRYAQLYGAPPPRIASLAYDATALAAVLARTREKPYFPVEALTNPAGFAGIDGIFRFGADGLSQRGLAVLKVRPDGLRVVSPAPQTFDQFTN